MITSNTARRLRKGATLPAVCAPGDCFVKTSNGSEGQYVCLTANVWSGPFDSTSDTGDVVGPASSTDNAISRFDSTTGKLLQNSAATVDDSGSVNIPTGQTYKINNVALAKGDVGLGNVDNTVDSAKPVSTAQQTALDLKANLVSPSFTTPTLGVASATSVALGTGSAQFAQAWIKDSTAGAIAIRNNTDADFGILRTGRLYVSASDNSLMVEIGLAARDQLRIGSAGGVSFSSTTAANGTNDVAISRADVNVLQVGTAVGNANGTVRAAKFCYSATVCDWAGAGSPDGVVTAGIGSTYRNTTDGSFYRKTSGTGNTGWVTP